MAPSRLLTVPGMHPEQREQGEADQAGASHQQNANGLGSVLGFRLLRIGVMHRMSPVQALYRLPDKGVDLC